MEEECDFRQLMTVCESFGLDAPEGCYFEIRYCTDRELLDCQTYFDENTQFECNDLLTDSDEWRNVREQAFWKETSDPNWRELYQRLEAWHGYEDPDCDLVKVKAECSDFEFLREQG